MHERQADRLIAALERIATSLERAESQQSQLFEEVREREKALSRLVTQKLALLEFLVTPGEGKN